MKENKDILYKDECYKIYGCIYAVNKKLGSGFLEAVYQEALTIELHREQIPFIAQKPLFICYDGILLSKKYVVDLLCYDKIIIEIKAVTALITQHKAQLMNYLAVSGLQLGLLVNFGAFPKAEILRIVN